MDRSDRGGGVRNVGCISIAGVRLGRLSVLVVLDVQVAENVLLYRWYWL